jgi:uncharacterized membrane protein YfcA
VLGPLPGDGPFPARRSPVPLDLPALAIALVVTFAGAVLQGTIGFGMALVTVPVLSLVDPVLTPVPQLLIALPMSLAMLWRERHHVDFHGIGWVLAGRIPGVAIGLWMLASFARPELEVAIAAIVMAAVLIFALGLRVPRTPVTGFAAGTASGVTGLVASMGGPPLALLYRQSNGAAMRASLAVVFSVGLGVSIAARSATGNVSGDDLVMAGLLAPALAGGLALSTRLKGRIEDAVLRAAVLWVSGISAVVLAIRALGA